MLVRSYRTVSPLPDDMCRAVCSLLHFPYPDTPNRSIGTVGVTHHRVLWRSDFPQSRSVRNRGRLSTPNDSIIAHTQLRG